MKTADRSQSSNTRNLLIGAFIALIAPAMLVACGESEWREVKAPVAAPSDVKTGDLAPGQALAGQPAYVAPETLPARTAPDSPPSSDLPRGQEVRVVDPTPIGKDELITVTYDDEIDEPAAAPKIEKKSLMEPPVLEKKAPAKKKVSPKAARTTKKTVYVPIRSLQRNPVDLTEADRYIMIQNVATEKLRVYERAATSGAPHRLIFETDMIAGENDPEKTRRTMLGSYKIEKWIKFYQDEAKLFPPWWSAVLPDPPSVGATLEDWTRPSFLPVINGKSQGLVRGAFGWYTAKIGPNAAAQWTHGTIGWGADGGRFIQLPKEQLRQYYSDPRSFGCTRVENRAIAFLQAILPVGTRVIKVYAKEALADKSLALYKTQSITEFDWLLTKDEVRKVNPNSTERAEQRLRDVEESLELERGVYPINGVPSAVTFKKSVESDRFKRTIEMVAPEANLYALPEASFRGEFLVDEGRFKNYAHPKELRKGGYAGEILPNILVKK